MKNIAAGYKTHGLVISGLVVIWGTFAGGGFTLAEAIQRSLEVLSISTLRIAVGAVVK
jgi:hypothetical protein